MHWISSGESPSLVLELLRNGRTVVEKLAVDQTSNENSCCRCETKCSWNPGKSRQYRHHRQNSVRSRAGRARHNKLPYRRERPLDGLGVQTQAVAVSSHDVQAAAFDFKQAAGCGWASLSKPRENGLRDHALEDGLRQRSPLSLAASASRIFVSLAGHQVEH